MASIKKWVKMIDNLKMYILLKMRFLVFADSFNVRTGGPFLLCSEEFAGVVISKLHPFERQ